MAQAQEITSRRYFPPKRLPGETLEAYIIRRAAMMRKVQAFIGVYVEEIEALGDGPEAERLIKALRALQDEEVHLWLQPDEEAIPHGHGARMEISRAIIDVQNALAAARTSGRFDEVRRLEAEERRLSVKYEKIYHPDWDAVEAQRDLDDRGDVCHHSIRQDLERSRTKLATLPADHPGRSHWESQEQLCLEKWERACRDADEARKELLAQGLIRPRPTAAHATAAQ